MTKHSPAPWTCHPNFSTSHIYHVYDGNECFFAADDIDCETQKANAALIAAAPELLAALKSILHLLPDYPPHDPNHYIVADARKAMHKARGE